MRTRPLHSLLARYSSNTADGGGSLYNELVGSRAHIERKKAFFSEKYKDVLQRKAQQEGLPDVHSLRQKYQATRAAQEPTNPGARYSAKKDSRPSRDSSPAPSSQKSSSGPGIKASFPSFDLSRRSSAFTDLVQPLSDILDLSKVADLNSQALANLWTAYHQEKGFLSAAIPISTYRTMVETAKKYPMFVLPLARETAEQEGAVEMHLTVSHVLCGRRCDERCDRLGTNSSPDSNGLSCLRRRPTVSQLRPCYSRVWLSIRLDKNTLSRT